MYNLDPRETFFVIARQPCACGCRKFEWNGHDGVWECYDCGHEPEQTPEAYNPFAKESLK